MSSVVDKIQGGVSWVFPAEVHRVRKVAAYSLGAGIVILFGDVLLPFAWHLLILALEVLEALMDHALESLFGLDPWTAQLITAWTGFFVALTVSVMAVRKVKQIYRLWRARFSAWREEHVMHF